jgi:hypothetical protein
MAARERQRKLAGQWLDLYWMAVRSREIEERKLQNIQQPGESHSEYVQRLVNKGWR